MTLPPSVSNLIKVFIMLLLFGILFANSIIIMIALVPLLFTMAGLLLSPPSEVSMKRTVSRGMLHAGDWLLVSLEIEINSGVGVFIVSDSLPPNFRLLEGNNLQVLWKGFGTKTVTLTYKVQCSTSGTYYLNTVKWQSQHCLYQHWVYGVLSQVQTIEVRPRRMEMVDLKSTSTVSRIPLPQGSLIKTGISTMDFNELRLYTSGDSFKDVNWKATARNFYKGTFWPIVNDYEKEGKKVVWIFLDTSKKMTHGTNVRNAFECGVEAVSGLADYYLKMNCQVSLCTFNGEQVFLYPGSGKKQYHRILTELMKMNKDNMKSPHSQNRMMSLKEAVNSHKAYYAGIRPLFVVVTRYGEDNSSKIAEGIMEMTKFTSHYHGRFQVMVVNIDGYELAADSSSELLASVLLEMRDENLSQSIKGRCIWVDWNPLKYSFTKALIHQVVKG